MTDGDPVTHVLLEVHDEQNVTLLVETQTRTLAVRDISIVYWILCGEETIRFANDSPYGLPPASCEKGNPEYHSPQHYLFKTLTR